MQGHCTVHGKRSRWGFDPGAAGSMTLPKARSAGAPAQPRAAGDAGVDYQGQAIACGSESVCPVPLSM